MASDAARLATSPAKPPTKKQIEARLRKVAAKIKKLTDPGGTLEELYSERLECYQDGVAQGVTHDTLAEWADCSSVAVSKVLSKASKQARQ